MEFDIESAKEEIQSKDDAQIDKETGIKWCERTCAAYQLYSQTGNIKWLIMGTDFAGEAVEHSAKANDGGETLSAVQAEIAKYKPSVAGKVESRQAPARVAAQPIVEAKKRSLVDAFDDCGIPKGM